MNTNLENGVTLIPFEEGSVDRFELFSLYKATLHDHIDLAFGWDDAFQRRRFTDAYETADIWLIGTGSGMAGYAVVRMHDELIHLKLLILKPGFQRQGIGRTLLTSLMSTAVQTGANIALSCFRSNSAAVAFYESLGFKVASAEEHFLNYRFSPSAG